MLHKRAGVTLDDFTLGYITCALWTGRDDRDGMNDAPLDAEFSIEDIAGEALQAMIADCEQFQRENGETLDTAMDSPDYRRGDDFSPGTNAGHAFCVARRAHGDGG